MKEACDRHLLHNISLPSNGPILSHIMYVNYVTFWRELTQINIINLNRLLRCFYLSFGLKVNLYKSKVFRVGVDHVGVNRFDNILNCESASFPFMYLELPVGANMKLAWNWNPIIDKFKPKFSTWKTKNLSFGGRPALVNSVLGSLPLYYFSLFRALKKV